LTTPQASHLATSLLDVPLFDGLRTVLLLLVVHVTVVEAIVGRLDRGLRGRGRCDAADGCCGNNRCGRRRSGLEARVLTDDRGGSRSAERVRPEVRIKSNIAK